MLALIFAAVVAQTETVTLTHPCAHSSIVLEAFGNQIGETIKPSGSVNKDYFLIRFDEMPVEDAKAAIAKTLNATWSRKGDVLYLTRTRAQERAEEKAITEELRRSIQRSIDAAIKRNQERKPYVLTDVIEEMRNQDSRRWFDNYSYNESPLQRFKDRIEATLTVDDLMSLPLGSTFYSTDPASGDNAFPSAWTAIVKKYGEDRLVWYRARLGAGLDDEYGYAYDSSSGSVVDEITLVFARTPESVVISLTVRVDNGSLGTSFGGGRGIGRSNNEWRGFYRDLEEPVEISKEMMEAWNFVSPSGGLFFGRRRPRVRTRTEVPRLLAQVINDLPNNEPLTGLVSWPILEAAERKETNIVALFGDGVLQWPFGDSIEEGATLTSVFGYGWSNFVATFDKDLSCWIARSPNPVAARKYRMDRPAFAALLKKAWTDGWIRLNDMAGFIRRTGIEALERSWQTWLGIAEFSAQDDLTWLVYSGDDLSTAVYSRLSPSQQRAAWSGGIELPLSFWPTGVWQSLSTSNWRNQRLVPPGVERFSLEGQHGRRVSSLFKGRLPAGTTLRIQVVQGTELWVGHEESGFQMDLEMYAQISIDPDYGGRTGMKVDRVAVGPTETLTVELVVPNAGSIVMTAEFRRVPFVDELGPVDQLPASAQAAIAAAIQKARGGR